MELFNQSTVYLYDSADYWRGRGVTEGFGLPPLEALACGCVVFSSLNHALADHGDACRAVHQIGGGRLGVDVHRIKRAVLDPLKWRPQVDQLEACIAPYTGTRLLESWREALKHLDAFDALQGPSLVNPATWQLRWRQRLQRVRRVVDRTGRHVLRGRESPGLVFWSPVPAKIVPDYAGLSDGSRSSDTGMR